MTQSDSILRKTTRLVFQLTINLVIPVAIIYFGYNAAKNLIETAPQAERTGGSTEELARFVRTIPLESGTQQAVIDVMGLVQPARQATVQPLVGGQIISISENVEAGGLISKDEVLFNIESTDYDIAILQRQAEVKRNESFLEIEKGQQRVARQEIELLENDIQQLDLSLVLREPQLLEAEANLAAAKAALRRAEVDLARTVIAAPMDALVIEENVEQGVIASSNEELIQIVGTEAFWVELAVPVDNLRWIKMPDESGDGGSRVEIFDRAAWGDGVSREGRIVRYNPNVDPASRMARIVVEIEDPLTLMPENAGKPPLLLNSYVRAEVFGQEFEDTFAIPREYIREGDRVWVMGEDERLDIRKLDVLWSGLNEVFVRHAVSNGDLLVTTNMSAPVENMLLRTDDVTEQTPQQGDDSILVSDSGENAEQSPSGDEAVPQESGGQ